MHTKKTMLSRVSSVDLVNANIVSEELAYEERPNIYKSYVLHDLQQQQQYW
jgi:hypothetical protein